MDTGRARGVMVRLACGDAPSRPVEFTSASQISAQHGILTEMIGHGTWNQPTGTITDDIEQALCIPGWTASSISPRGVGSVAEPQTRVGSSRGVQSIGHEDIGFWQDRLASDTVDDAIAALVDKLRQ